MIYNKHSILFGVIGVLSLSLFSSIWGLSAEPIIPGLMSSKLEAEMKGHVLLEELNCAACHESDALFVANSKVAPRLSDIGSRVNPAYIASFISDPHGVKPGTTMPDVLKHFDEKEKREVAESLTHYLLSLKENSFSPEAPDRVAAIEGKKLFHARGCVACHSPRDEEGVEILSNRSAPLGELDKKYSHKSLKDFLRNPHVSRPSGRMPDLNLLAKEIESISHYLLQNTVVPGNLKFTLYEGPVKEGIDSDAVVATRAGHIKDFSRAELEKTGRLPRHHYAVVYEGWVKVEKSGTYHFYTEMNGGTLGIDGKEIISEDPSDRRGPNKHEAGVKLEAGWRKLDLTYYNTGMKPVFTVEMDGEGLKRRSVSTMTLSTSDKTIPAFKPLVVNSALAAQGKQHFENLRCANCHDDLGVDKKPAPPLASLDLKKGCISNSPKKSPHYGLSDEQKQLLRKGIAHATDKKLSKLTDIQQVDKTLTQFNCTACHERDDLGGISVERNGYFTGTHPELGDQGRLPPPLSHVGAKLKPEWISEVMLRGGRQRQYLNTRMPQYGEGNVGHLVELLAKVDKLEDVKIPQIANIQESKNAGYEMIGVKGFSCIACHDFNGPNPSGAGALDLAYVTKHVKKNWFHLFMQNPSRFHTTGIMPNYWPGGKSIRPDVLNGNSADQIEALWTYLSDNTQAKKPLGLSRKTSELRVFDVPEITRGRGTAGFRGIGVGYPGRLNLAFDSEEMALRLLWKEGFASVNHGSFKAIGKSKVAFPAGIPFHRLESLEGNWPYKGKTDYEFPQNMGYQFLGYRLDEKKRPTFRYRYGEITVEDFFEEVVGKDGVTRFKRTFSFDAQEAQSEFYFRAASGKRVRKLDDQSYQIGSLKITFDSEYKGIVREGDPAEVLIPLTLPKGASTLTLTYQW